MKYQRVIIERRTTKETIDNIEELETSIDWKTDAIVEVFMTTSTKKRLHKKLYEGDKMTIIPIKTEEKPAYRKPKIEWSLLTNILKQKGIMKGGKVIW